jgi:hypothetical protein
VQELWTGLNRTDQARVFPTIGSKLTPYQIQVFVQVRQVLASYVLKLATKTEDSCTGLVFLLRIKPKTFVRDKFVLFHNFLANVREFKMAVFFIILKTISLDFFSS